MREILSRFDKATDFIDKFLEMDNSTSIVLSLYRGEKSRLSKRYPTLTFTVIEATDESKKLYKYLIQKN